jgi:lipid-binding SYLF domain-containing protein
VKLGGDATATAGPVGRDVAAESDAMLMSEMLTYARSKGLFGGATLAPCLAWSSEWRR